MSFFRTNKPRSFRANFFRGETAKAVGASGDLVTTNLIFDFDYAENSLITIDGNGYVTEVADKNGGIYLSELFQGNFPLATLENRQCLDCSFGDGYYIRHDSRNEIALFFLFRPTNNKILGYWKDYNTGDANLRWNCGASGISSSFDQADPFITYDASLDNSHCLYLHAKSGDWRVRLDQSEVSIDSNRTFGSSNALAIGGHPRTDSVFNSDIYTGYIWRILGYSAGLTTSEIEQNESFLLALLS